MHLHFYPATIATTRCRLNFNDRVCSNLACAVQMF